MTIRVVALAAAALSLVVPATAMAQPFYGPDSGYLTREKFRRDGGRRFQHGREFRKLEDLQRLRWRREHDHRFVGRRYR
jgi:hypothetical protein